MSKFLCEPIDTGAMPLNDFDREVDAIRGLLGIKGVMSVDELRRGIEAIPEAQYHRMSYYQRWIRSSRRQPDRPRRHHRGRTGGGVAMMAAGSTVRVRDDWPEARGPVHTSAPRNYLRGHTGTVLRHLGDFPNPEDLAFARPAQRLPLYHVAFDARTIWPDAAADELLVEIFEPWLEPRP